MDNPFFLFSLPLCSNSETGLIFPGWSLFFTRSVLKAGVVNAPEWCTPQEAAGEDCQLLLQLNRDRRVYSCLRLHRHEERSSKPPLPSTYCVRNDTTQLGMVKITALHYFRDPAWRGNPPACVLTRCGGGVFFNCERRLGLSDWQRKAARLDRGDKRNKPIKAAELRFSGLRCEPPRMNSLLFGPW